MLNLLLVRIDYFKTASERTVCVWERSHLVPRLFKVYILWYIHDKCTPCSRSPPPPPLLQLQLVGPGSTSEPVTGDSGFISYRRTPAKHCLSPRRHYHALLNRKALSNETRQKHKDETCSLAPDCTHLSDTHANSLPVSCFLTENDTRLYPCNTPG